MNLCFVLDDALVVALLSLLLLLMQHCVHCVCGWIRIKRSGTVNLLLAHIHPSTCVLLSCNEWQVHGTTALPSNWRFNVSSLSAQKARRIGGKNIFQGFAVWHQMKKHPKDCAVAGQLFSVIFVHKIFPGTSQHLWHVLLVSVWAPRNRQTEQFRKFLKITKNFVSFGEKKCRRCRKFICANGQF